MYEFTYNDPRKQFTQSSLCLLFELPTTKVIKKFQKVKVLAVPSGMKDHAFDPNTPLNAYIEDGWKETFVSTAPARTIICENRIQGQQRQYGLKHQVTSTIHASMGDTLLKVAIQISNDNHSFKLWDKAQVIVAISCTKLGANTIFVGDKDSTIKALVSIIQFKYQWTDYMESVLEVVSINMNSNGQESTVLFQPRIQPFCICDLPLPECKTGFVYMLVSCCEKDFAYIGETISI